MYTIIDCTECCNQGHRSSFEIDRTWCNDQQRAPSACLRDVPLQVENCVHLKQESCNLVNIFGRKFRKDDEKTPRKNIILQARLTQILRLWRIVFFLTMLTLLKLFKISHFWPKSIDLGRQFLKINLIRFKMS